MSAWLEIIPKILEALLKYFNKKSSEDGVLRIIAIYDAMKAAINEGLVQRFLILKLENGGGTIKPNVNLYASVIHEDFDNQFFDSVKTKYQRILVDKDYITLVGQAMTTGYADVFTKNMPDSILKTIYESENVVYSEWYYLHSDKKAIYYCTVGTSDLKDTFDNPHQRNCINIQINQIRNAISGKKMRT